MTISGINLSICKSIEVSRPWYRPFAPESSQWQRRFFLICSYSVGQLFIERPASSNNVPPPRHQNIVVDMTCRDAKRSESGQRQTMLYKNAHEKVWRNTTHMRLILSHMHKTNHHSSSCWQLRSCYDPSGAFSCLIGWCNVPLRHILPVTSSNCMRPPTPFSHCPIHILQRATDKPEL